MPPGTTARHPQLTAAVPSLSNPPLQRQTLAVSKPVQTSQAGPCQPVLTVHPCGPALQWRCYLPVMHHQWVAMQHDSTSGKAPAAMYAPCPGPISNSCILAWLHSSHTSRMSSQAVLQAPTWLHPATAAASPGGCASRSSLPTAMLPCPVPESAAATASRTVADCSTSSTPCWATLWRALGPRALRLGS